MGGLRAADASAFSVLFNFLFQSLSASSGRREKRMTVALDGNRPARWNFIFPSANRRGGLNYNRTGPIPRRQNAQNVLSVGNSRIDRENEIEMQTERRESLVKGESRAVRVFHDTGSAPFLSRLTLSSPYRSDGRNRNLIYSIGPAINGKYHAPTSAAARQRQIRDRLTNSGSAQSVPQAIQRHSQKESAKFRDIFIPAFSNTL